LKQLEEQRSAMEEARHARRNLFMLRIVRLTIGILFIFPLNFLLFSSWSFFFFF